MMARLTLWLRSLILRQRLRIGLTIAGIGLTVALLVSLFGFIAATEASMTARAITSVPVDWQIQLGAGQSADATAAELAKAPGYTHLEEVGYFTSPGLQATTGTTVQTTGAGVVLGVSDTYRTSFPSQIRPLAGEGHVLLAQQTAANLHAVPGTKIVISRPGLDPLTVTVDAIVDLPYADSLFQRIGAPPGAGPTAPPDNVLIMPLAQWHTAFDPVAGTSPSSVQEQLHATIPHQLSSSPSQAFITVSGEAKNLESRTAGQVVVGNNLAARLDIARSDALYARVLFLFLGLPGVLLAMVLTGIYVLANSPRRRREQALVRLRGATSRQIVQLAAAESLGIGAIGSGIGLLIGTMLVPRIAGTDLPALGNRAVLLWQGVAVLTGCAISFLVGVLPSWWEARTVNVQASRRVIRQERAPVWERCGLDLVLLALAAGAFWQASRNGYQVLVVPEGIPTVSVHYSSFVAPLCLWIGGLLFLARIFRWLLARNGVRIAPLLRLPAGALSSLISSSLSRQRPRVTTGFILIVLALAFAWSTSVFNATYAAQARVDAELSNGSDVTVTAAGGTDLATWQNRIAAIPGVASVEAMYHRFAYVGADLQDLYGVMPSSFPRSVHLSDSFFANTTADSAMEMLARQPDGILVSPETVKDYQLSMGDTIRIRLLNARDHAYHPVSFTVVGIVREFPTAPTDSFLVANTSYLAEQTGASTVETLLVRTTAGISPSSIGDQVRSMMGPGSGATVRDIEDQQRAINSGLTAISLHGLTRIELGFVVILAIASATLVLYLGFDDRRRSLAITRALGATDRQLGAFTWGEAGIVLIGGLVGGAALGALLASMLVKLLTGVFDPPPDAVSVPWGYLAVMSVTMAGAISVVGHLVNRAGRRDILPTIRRLF